MTWLHNLTRNKNMIILGDINPHNLKNASKAIQRRFKTMIVKVI